MTGLTSNPTIFDHAIKNSTEYDAPIREKLRDGETVEQVPVKSFKDLTELWLVGS